MNDLWLWLFGLVALISLAVFLFPMISLFPKPALAPKKLELPPKQLPAEEMAEEISPVLPQRVQEEILLPHHYGVSRLVAVAKDPRWLYAYWEVSATTQQEFIKKYGQDEWHNSRPVLRVYDVTGLNESNSLTGHSFQEIYIDPFADNWFIQVGQPERSFILELGRLLTNGIYVRLLISNKVSTPRDSISPRLDENWMWLEGLYPNPSNWCYGTSSGMLAGREEQNKN
ncbi:DUF4912 domain-containing protein [Desulforamulus ferrireducens]|uniref:DUF4912 domain-containing protein n=1 Tax=Desulforamulus ferrireducens TaxID=1833852 RepID=A0A1S6IYB0_9FIRM|nr:DUF4912 domain-containing protein [Desulforamulus ferrireducens]AQS59746.1 DUF4912 domain-containing protein [Desulforamulus ferrireducens]